MTIDYTSRFGFQDPCIGFDGWFAGLGFGAAYWAGGSVEALRVGVYL
jgi:hypothetical protein